MKNLLPLISLYFLSLLLFSCQSESNLSSPWHHPLYLGNNGFWKQRIPVTIRNTNSFDLKGDPVSLVVGKAKNQLPLNDVLAESIRVTNASGEQLLFGLLDKNGNRIEKGKLTNGSTITLPVECKKGEKSDCFIYFDNASAWPVGEYFNTHIEIHNGGFEQAGEFGLLGWEMEWPEDNRDIRWSDSEFHSGEYSLELFSDKVENKETYGVSQADIHLIPGASYEIEAWFKSENIEGEAGLIVSPANLGRTQRDLRLQPIRLKTSTNGSEWKRESLTFTAPKEANILTINSFINGKGKVWIDDIKLRCNVDYYLSTEIFPIEKLQITESGKTSKWLSSGRSDKEEWPIRAVITVPNFTNISLKNHAVHVDIQQLKNRLYSEIDESTLMQVTDEVTPIPYLIMGDAVLFRQDIPAFTERTFYLYFSKPAVVENRERPKTYTDMSQLSDNLIVNSEFETDFSGWERFGETDSKQISLDKQDKNTLVQISYTETEDETRTQVSDIEITHTVTDAELGLYQILDIEPGKSYFYSARIKASMVQNRTKTIRAGFLGENRELIGDEVVLKTNPDVYQNNEWVYESMIIQAPVESSSVKVELLNADEGAVWFDEIFFMEIGTGYTGALALERIAERDLEGLQVWEKSPLVKVFPDDLPDKPLDKISISAAKNDVEAAQLLFRSSGEYKNLKIELNPIADKNNNSLDSIEIGIVHYVPINYPSSYYRDFETPFWLTKMPKAKIGSDGWTGWWPDPILPFQNFDLPANMTKAAWIEVTVPENAVAGLYSGTVQLMHKDEVIKDIPLELQVYDFVLPRASSVTAVYDLRFNEREMFGRKTTEQQKNEEVWKYMARHRISPETIRPQPKFTVENGEVMVDFTEFDKAAAYYFDELNFTSTYSPWDFYLFGWGHSPKDKFGEKPYPGEAPYHDADRSKLRPEYKKVYQSALRQYWEHMKEKGWADRVVVYISDEPHAEPEILEQMKAVCDMIHEVDPDIRIYVSTWWYRPEFEGYVDVWGVSHRGGGWGHPVPAEHLQEIKKNGGEIFYTTDGMQCTDSPFLGFERMLPYFCFKYGASEYEFWAANWHTLNPYNYGWHRYHRQSPSADNWYWMRYPNGDGNFIYPGQPIGVDHLVASIRLKQAREGVEDYEFMNILDLLIKQGKSRGINTDKAQKALDGALNLISIPCADGRFTTKYTPDPNLLKEIRHEIATSIEALSKQVNSN